MPKQKIVVKVAMNDEKKSRKAMKIVVSVPGVESVSFIGSNKDQIALTGERIDSVELAKLLRKGVGHADLVSVGSVEEKKPAAPAIQTQGMVPQQVYPHHYNYGVPVPVPYNVHEVPYGYNNDPSCTIM